MLIEVNASVFRLHYYYYSWFKLDVNRYQSGKSVTKTLKYSIFTADWSAYLSHENLYFNLFSGEGFFCIKRQWGRVQRRFLNLFEFAFFAFILSGNSKDSLIDFLQDLTRGDKIGWSWRYYLLRCLFIVNYIY